MHESDSFVLITTLVTAFGLALIFGYLAERFLKTPALVGYIMAGVCVTLVPGLPRVDMAATQEFAELGVMLLMFGVGLHFSVADLIKVKGVAVTGALIQMTFSAIAGSLVAMLAWSWHPAQAIVFGLTLSCASTVVVMKALEIRHFTSGMHGQVVIGWLVVQDLVAVFIMVCMPILAQLMTGKAMSAQEIAVELSSTLLGVAIFVASMLLVGRRLFPFMLRKVAELGSRELFTLCVLALAIGVAYGAGVIFHVSYALGAFFAGMVMRESNYAHRAAVNSLPLQDAFAVLFFVSVGLLLDWHVFITQPLAVISVMMIIMLITSTIAMFLVVLLGWPLQTAMIVGTCLSQIGEFSFILCAQGISLGMADKSTMSLIVAASILTIALNPLMFYLMPKVKFFLVTRYPYMRRAAMRESPLSQPVTTSSAGAITPVLNNHVIVVGFNETVKSILLRLKTKHLPVVCLVTPDDHLPDPAALGAYGAAMIVGDPLDPMALVKARVTMARLLVLPDADPVYNRQVLTKARQLNPEVKVLVRVNTDDEIADFSPNEDTAVISDAEATVTLISQEINTAFQDLHGPVSAATATTTQHGEALDYGPQAMEVPEPSFVQKQVKKVSQNSKSKLSKVGSTMAQGLKKSSSWFGGKVKSASLKALDKLNERAQKSKRDESESSVKETPLEKDSVEADRSSDDKSKTL